MGNDKYINAIGVLSYTLDNPPVTLTPQYYYKSDPPIVSSNTDANFYAFGWLFGGNNITAIFDITSDEYTLISSLNTLSYDYPKPYLYGSYTYITEINLLNPQPVTGNNYIVNNMCGVTVQTNLPNTVCYISGNISGDINTLKCDGTMNGYLLNTLNNAKLYVNAFVSGQLQQITGYVDYQLALIKSLNGVVRTASLNTVGTAGINSTDRTNILGRQLLAYANSLNGYNLNIYPERSKNEYTGLKHQMWKIVEVFNTDKEKFNKSQLSGTKLALNNSQLLIKTNQKILSYGKLIDNYLVNYPPIILTTQNKAYKLDIDTALQYYAFYDIKNSYVYLYDNLNDDILNTVGYQLWFGPIATYDMAINLLEAYCYANNYTIEIQSNNKKQTEFHVFEQQI